MEISRYLTKENLDKVAKKNTFLLSQDGGPPRRPHNQYFYFKARQGAIDPQAYYLRRVDRPKDKDGVEVAPKYYQERNLIGYHDIEELTRLLYTPGYNGIREGLVEACKKVSVSEKLELI